MKSHSRLFILFLLFLTKTTLAYAQQKSLAGMVGLEVCSGAVVRFEGQSLNSQALILTAGHCVFHMPPGQFLAHVPSGKILTLFNDRDTKVRHQFHPNEIIYATMTGMDIAVYQLKETYVDLEKLWSVPNHILSRQVISTGSVLAISGRFATATACQLNGFTALREDQWDFPSALRLDQCPTKHGMSGMPLLSTLSHEIVGILFANNVDGAKCTLDNACEVNSGGLAVVRGRSYGIATANLYLCLNEKHEFDPFLAGCPLPQRQ